MCWMLVIFWSCTSLYPHFVIQVGTGMDNAELWDNYINKTEWIHQMNKIFKNKMNLLWIYINWSACLTCSRLVGLFSLFFSVIPGLSITRATPPASMHNAMLSPVVTPITPQSPRLQSRRRAASSDTPPELPAKTRSKTP